ncbi:hypothetical protein IFM89_016713 [Coptis chinensis]|uniref:LOB domain-containing protein n=1 Tax=Coptis chinensis TaxID=261450 RepID=A0A835MBS3_9MAGN|nr:hypothetical protein IFM89_016713 [Coptis chinensis]
MSCNGCRVLRKGCSESCILRPCLQWIESPEAQGHATVFVAKFFGRAGLMSFISAVPETQRPALFQSLLFEACGRTVNPVNGAVGLLWTGNWNICQASVDTVLRGGTLRPMTEFVGGILMQDSDDVSEVVGGCSRNEERYQDPYFQPKLVKRKGIENMNKFNMSHSDVNDLDLSLCPRKFSKLAQAERGEKQRPTTPSMYSSEESVTTSLDSGCGAIAQDRRHHHNNRGEKTLLNLFM